MRRVGCESVRHGGDTSAAQIRWHAQATGGDAGQAVGDAGYWNQGIRQGIRRCRRILTRQEWSIGPLSHLGVHVETKAFKFLYGM